VSRERGFDSVAMPSFLRITSGHGRFAGAVVMHTVFRVFSGIIVFSAVFISAAKAAEPSFRYCEGGYNLERFSVQESARASRVIGTTGQVVLSSEYDDGNGFQLGCKLEVFKGFYAFGDYSEASLGGLVQSTVGGVPAEEGDLTDAHATRWRVGAGYSYVIAPGVAAYAQVGAGSLSFNPGGGVILGGAGGGGGFFPARATQRLSVDGEVGVRWAIVPRIEVGAFVRYDGAGGVRAVRPLFLSVSVAREDEFRGGGTIAVRIAGPIWISGRYEIGQTDRAFIGGRVAF